MSKTHKNYTFKVGDRVRIVSVPCSSFFLTQRHKLYRQALGTNATIESFVGDYNGSIRLEGESANLRGMHFKSNQLELVKEELIQEAKELEKNQLNHCPYANELTKAGIPSSQKKCDDVSFCYGKNQRTGKCPDANKCPRNIAEKKKIPSLDDFVKTYLKEGFTASDLHKKLAKEIHSYFPKEKTINLPTAPGKPMFGMFDSYHKRNGKWYGSYFKNGHRPDTVIIDDFSNKPISKRGWKKIKKILNGMPNNSKVFHTKGFSCGMDLGSKEGDHTSICAWKDGKLVDMFTKKEKKKDNGYPLPKDFDLRHNFIKPIKFTEDEIKAFNEAYFPGKVKAVKAPKYWDRLTKCAEIAKERGESYGDIKKNFRLASSILYFTYGLTMKPHQIAEVLECVKSARNQNSEKDDNTDDKINYIAIRKHLLDNQK